MKQRDKMTTAEQRIPLLPSAAANVLKTLGNQVHAGDDSLIAGSLSNNGKIILQPSVPDSWACMAQVASSRFAYDSLFQNGVGAYGRYVERYQPFDISVLAGSRRKNATRETTSTLKAWLHEHRKNPYPTKGEKIMLAILTKMTLTQVSTWFANARRRLKKENKMTWLPRNKSGSREGDKNSNEEHGNNDENDNTDSEDDSDFESDDERSGMNDMDTLMPGESHIEDNTNTRTDKQIKNDQIVKKDSNFDNKSSAKGPVWSFEAEAIKQAENMHVGIGNSPVNSLQRWVNVCFETQSPVDFPKELTPPHTPVELKRQGTSFNTSMNCSVKEERTVMDTKYDNTRKQMETGVNLSENSESSLTLSSLARLTETRPCILTSHRELDAVLALTSLASR